MDRVEVKTKAAAEKAIKAGKPVRIIAGRFALAVAGLSGVDIHIAATAEIELTLTNVVGTVAQDDMWTSRVVARGSSRVVAREWSRVVARGSSRVEAWGSSSVVARGSSRVEAWGSSSVEAWGSSSVVAREWSSVVAREWSRVEAWGSSSVVARGSSRVEAWGSSSVEAWGSSSVEAWGSSRVVAREWSRVVARGFSQLQAHGDRVKIEASAGVAVNLWEGAKAKGGRQFEVELSTAQDWCDYYGVRTENGTAIVYKATKAEYRSYHGGDYTPGTMPEDTAWNGKKGECERGCGLNFSPTPRHTHEFEREPKHYLECRVSLDEMVVHFNGQYPQKCTARRVAAPLVEVDVDGNPIEVAEK